MADAACREHPEVTTAVCSSCLVREECGAYGRRNGEVGIWGGQVRRSPRGPSAEGQAAMAVQVARWQRQALAARRRAGIVEA